VSPTSAVSTTARLANETGRAPREQSCLATALSTACQAGDRPLTLSVAPRPGWDPAGAQSTEEPAPIPSPLRQMERLPRYRASSTDKCSRIGFRSIRLLVYCVLRRFHVAARNRDVFTSRYVAFARYSGGNPPPVSWLCHHDPGFRRFFAPLPLSRWRARPEAAPRAIHPWPPRAARRLSISASDTTREHNCAIVQTPPTTPVVAHARSYLHSTYLGA
jgi:hypothetical protein